MPSIDDYYQEFKELDFILPTYEENLIWLQQYVDDHRSAGIPIAEDKKRMFALQRIVDEMKV